MGQSPFWSKISTAHSLHTQPWPQGMKAELGGFSKHITHNLSPSDFFEWDTLTSDSFPNCLLGVTLAYSDFGE